MSLLGIQLFPSRPDPGADKAERDVLEAFRHGFQWIKDENLLRDEGVISGIAQVPAENKTRLIQYYIEFEKAPLEAEMERLEKLLEQKEEERKRLFNEAKEEEVQGIDEASSAPESHFVEALVKLIVLTLTLLACYYLLYWWLYDLTNLPELIALGVLCFGTFSIFLPRPYLFDLEGFYESMPLFKRWRVYFETFIPPLAATIFAIAWGRTQEVTSWKIFALALFLFVLFLITGRLFLRHLRFTFDEGKKVNAAAQRRIRTWRKIWRSRAQEKRRKQRCQALGQEIAALQERLHKLRQDWESLDRLNATLVEYFQTEYDLATSYLDNPSDEDQ